MFTKLMKFRRHPNRVEGTLGGHLCSVILWHSSWIVAIAKNEKVAPVTSLLYIETHNKLMTVHKFRSESNFKMFAGKIGCQPLPEIIKFVHVTC